MSDATAISVLGICGSLRKGSFNMAALRTAIEL
jgi:NAD(P)H-dependent FMN reductase